MATSAKSTVTRKEKLEKLYKELEGMEFEATYIGSWDSKFTGNPRDRLEVKPASVKMNHALEDVYSQIEDDEFTWKGITVNQGVYTLWVQQTEELHLKTDYNCMIDSIEVVEGLKWKNTDYKALVDIQVTIQKKGKNTRE